LLLKKGANPNHRDKAGRNAADYAWRLGALAALDELVSRGCVTTPLNTQKDKITN
jgi:hypothetical protein